jgi:uncharacterized protein YdhG (YjbR/CyaY superfamily)
MPSHAEYLATVPKQDREAIERVRQFVLRTVPEAEEGTSYGMPAFKYQGRPLLGFRVSKNHLSVFPFSAAAVDAARVELTGCDVTKGTVRFTAEAPVPESALEQMVRHRLGEIESK